MKDPLTGDEITKDELQREIKLVEWNRDHALNEYEEIVWLKVLEKRKQLLEQMR